MQEHWHPSNPHWEPLLADVPSTPLRKLVLTQQSSTEQPGRRCRTLFKASNFLLSPRQRVRAAAFPKSPKLAPHFLSIKGTTQKYAHSLTFLGSFYYSSLGALKTFLPFPMFTCFNHAPTVNPTPTHSSQNISPSICVLLPLSKP